MTEDDPFPAVPPMTHLSLFGIEVVGFTGTREGMTDQQKHCVYHIMQEIRPMEVHHGDCIGADANFHQIVQEHSPNVTIVGHPPILTKYRAFCQVDISWAPGEYHERDKDIVTCSGLLLACPKGIKEEVRSGTWTTVRFARKQYKPIKIVWPDGSVSQEN